MTELRSSLNIRESRRLARSHQAGAFDGVLLDGAPAQCQGLHCGGRQLDGRPNLTESSG